MTVRQLYAAVQKDAPRGLSFTVALRRYVLAYYRAKANLGAVLLAFAPPTARSGGAAEVYDFQFCGGYFALCAGSICTSTGGRSR
jgi:hypothetical protein